MAPRSLGRVARSAIPTLADFCLVYAVSNTSIVCVATAHATRAGNRLLRVLSRAYKIRRGDRASTVARVIATDRPTVRTEIRIETRPEGLVADLHRQLGPRSALVVPVVHQTRVLGAVSLCYAASGRTYSSDAVPAASALAARIAPILIASAYADARLRPPARRARDTAPLRRRVASRN